MLNKLFLVFCFCFLGVINAQIVVEDPVIAINYEWANHKIIRFEHHSQGSFVFLDDGSAWEINTVDHEWMHEREEDLVGIPVTIMPETGTEEFPVRIIVHGVKAWEDFSVHLESAPTQPGRRVIEEVLSEAEYPMMTIKKNVGEEEKKVVLVVNPNYRDIVKKWKRGQRVVVGGVWFPEYDPVGQRDYDCTFLFVVYNYDTNNFVFFDYDL